MIQVKLLDKIPFFKGFTSAEKDEISQVEDVQFLKYGSNEPIVNEGDEGSSFFIILKGTAAVYKRPLPEAVATLKPGNLFGEIAFLSPRTRTTSVVAENEVFLLRFEQGMMPKLSYPARDKLKDLLIVVLIQHLDALRVTTTDRAYAEAEASDQPKREIEVPFEANKNKEFTEKVIYEGEDGLKIIHTGALKAKLKKGDKATEVDMVALKEEMPGKFLKSIEAMNKDPSDYLYGENYVIPKAAQRAWEQTLVAVKSEMAEDDRNVANFQKIDNLYT